MEIANNKIHRWLYQENRRLLNDLKTHRGYPPIYTGCIVLHTCEDGTCSEKHKVDRDHLCGIKHFHCLIEKSVKTGEKKIRQLPWKKRPWFWVYMLQCIHALERCRSTTGEMSPFLIYFFPTASSGTRTAKIESGLWWAQGIEAKRRYGKSLKKKANRGTQKRKKPWLTWSGRRRRRSWRQAWCRRWGRWAAADLLLTRWSSLTRLWPRWQSGRLRQKKHNHPHPFSVIRLHDILLQRTSPAVNVDFFFSSH